MTANFPLLCTGASIKGGRAKLVESNPPLIIKTLKTGIDLITITLPSPDASITPTPRTVDPNKQYRGFLEPTTPAITGPYKIKYQIINSCVSF